MENTVEEYSWNNEQYERQIDQLEHKIEYLKNRNVNILADDSFLLDVFIESILIDIRAVMLESKRYKNNYTVQNSLKRGSENKNSILYKISQSIDDFFMQTKVNDSNMSLFEAIKFYTDKRIAHRDSISKEEFEKMKELKQYFVTGEYCIVDIVEQILDYTKKCKYSVMVASLNWLTGGDGIIDFDEQEERDYTLENAVFEQLIKCNFDQIDSILYLRAKGIKCKSNEIIRKVFDDKVAFMNTIERSKLLIRIKELEDRK